MLKNEMATMVGVHFLVTVILTTGAISERRDTSSNRKKTVHIFSLCEE